MSVVYTTDLATCPVLRSSLLPAVPHAFSTRHGGVSGGPYRSLNLGLSTADSQENVLANRRRFFRSSGVSASTVVAARLMHGGDVAAFHVDDPAGWPLEPSREKDPPSFRADGVVSDVADLSYFMTFADCVPLLFADIQRGVIGAAHAGWRGTAQGIAGAVVSVMRRDFGCDCANIVAVIGPSIGPCCYDVSQEVPDRFAANGTEPVLISGTNGKVSLDLWETNRRQLIDAGVTPENIDSFRLCTGCHTGDFYSHRKELGLTGRSGVCIGLDSGQ